MGYSMKHRRPLGNATSQDLIASAPKAATLINGLTSNHFRELL
jgi:hypothetical protein